MGAACCNVVWPARLVAMRRLPSSAHNLLHGVRIVRTQQRVRQHVGGWFLQLTCTALCALATSLCSCCRGAVPGRELHVDQRHGPAGAYPGSVSLLEPLG